MPDNAMTEKFDRWWAGQGIGPDSPANLARRWLEAAFMAGAAAERLLTSPRVGWLAVPEQVATRARARQLREQAVAEGCDVLNFAATEFISLTAADELVCNGTWTATTGENADVRETVERAQRRRGLIP